MKLKIPMSHSDAAALSHVVDNRISTCAAGLGGIDAVSDYGECSRWLEQLFQGNEIDVPDAELQRSRDVMEKAFG